MRVFVFYADYYKRFPSCRKTTHIRVATMSATSAVHCGFTVVGNARFLLCGLLTRSGTKVIASGSNLQVAYDFDSKYTQNLEIANMSKTEAVVCWTCHQLAEGISDPQFLCVTLKTIRSKIVIAHGPVAMDQPKILQYFDGPFSNQEVQGREDPISIQLQALTDQKALFCWGNRVGDRYRCTYLHKNLKFDKHVALLQHGFGAGFFYGVGFEITLSHAQLRPLDSTTSMLCALYNTTADKYQVGCSLISHNLQHNTAVKFGPRWLAGKEDADASSFTFGNFGAAHGFVCYRKLNGDGNCQGWARTS